MQHVYNNWQLWQVVSTYSSRHVHCTLFWLDMVFQIVVCICRTRVLGVLSVWKTVCSTLKSKSVCKRLSISVHCCQWAVCNTITARYFVWCKSSVHSVSTTCFVMCTIVGLCIQVIHLQRCLNHFAVCYQQQCVLW